MAHLVFALVFMMILSVMINYKIADAASTKINKTNIKINIGETYQLRIKGADSKLVKWDVSSSSIDITDNGLVTGVKAGSAYAIATVNNKYYKCKVTVMRPTLNYLTLKLGIGDTRQLEISNLPVNYNKNDIKYVSSDENVVSTDKNGLIKGLAFGNANIIVSFGDYKLTCIVTVIFSAQDLTKNIENYLEVQYGEANNQVICIVNNKSNIDMTFGYELAFYDASDNLVSLSGPIGAREGLFGGDSKVLFFDKTDKGYSYYKIRFSKVTSGYNYTNLKNKVNVTMSEPYSYTYEYTESVYGSAIKKVDTAQLIDLNIDNKSDTRAMIEACVIYYKGNNVVDVVDFTRYNVIVDIGTSIIKNPMTNHYSSKISIPDYDACKVIYSAKISK